MAFLLQVTDCWTQEHFKDIRYVCILNLVKVRVIKFCLECLTNTTVVFVCFRILLLRRSNPMERNHVTAPWM